MIGPALTLAVTLVPIVLAVVCHEVAHGWMARALGDRTAADAGRLTLNPLRHVDPVGTVVLPTMLALARLPVFGWAKPVPVDHRQLRHPRWGMMAVAAAGPGSNLLLATMASVALGLIARWGSDTGAVTQFVGATLDTFVVVNVFLALFNLLPVPPFDGSHIVEGLLPRRARQAYARLRPFGLIAMMLLLVVLPIVAPRLGVVQALVLPPADWLTDRLHALGATIAGR